ncbi:MAG: hypothetical protein HZB20_11065, partial [Chloroflexi bacterium]|nr:hypothetical protein [Chloroflexota bacterium]
MLTHTPTPPLQGPASQLRQEYESWQALFGAQPAIVQRFFEAQARQLADAIIQHVSQVRFNLPDRVVTGTGGPAAAVPPEDRDQMAGGLIDRLTRADTGAALRQRLSELEQSTHPAVAASAGLMRHATVTHLVRGVLPSGRTVNYIAAEGEEIPTVPMGDALEPASAITSTGDAIAEEGSGESEAGRGELLV